MDHLAAGTRRLAIAGLLVALLLAGAARVGAEPASRPMRFVDDRGAVLELDVAQHRVRFDVPAVPPGRAVSIDVPLAPRIDGRTTIALTIPANGLRVGVRVDPRRGWAAVSVVDGRSRWVAGMANGRLATRGAFPTVPTFTPTATPTPAPYPTWTPTPTIPLVLP